MTPDRWKHLEKVFARASELPVAEQAAFLAWACDGDEALRTEIDSLLVSSSGAESSLRDIIGSEVLRVLRDAKR